ncbi:provisional ortholog of olfactory receptor 1019 S homeolog [Xenopus laevis]|uniref:Olfactory receptor n=3 Tax=Xenopus laevis TaxID=8355 RepID=Q9I8C1_XENLA|nr:provisional ortholog of olfactory receptor 1019 S homeolog [Xenopus laevis]OCT69828.1 hypothetical protein XELAEV_18036753mg [Xenopus laevis]CAC00724.1 olfactory receptor class II [Xenopus laevis]
MTTLTSENQSAVTRFRVQCFSDKPDLQTPLFLIFLLSFLIIIIGNTSVFATIILSVPLHKPMYVFLGSLSVLDISSASTTLPNLLAMLHTQDKTISFAGCILQFYFFMAFAITEFILLSAMAYDRYVAICYPLHYALRMSLKHCAKIIVGVWVAGFLDPVLHSVLIAKLSFCSSNHINHFFCDLTPLLRISCSDTSPIEMINYIYGVIVGFSTFAITSSSYVFIMFKILNICSSEGKKKTLSTCTSHLTCVIIFYGTMMCLYLRPTKSFSPNQDIFALLYVVLIPMLNPFIYTLKNTEFKANVRKMSTRINFKLLSLNCIKKPQKRFLLTMFTK